MSQPETCFLLFPEQRPRSAFLGQSAVKGQPQIRDGNLCRNAESRHGRFRTSEHSRTIFMSASHRQPMALLDNSIGMTMRNATSGSWQAMSRHHQPPLVFESCKHGSSGNPKRTESPSSPEWPPVCDLDPGTPNCRRCYFC